MGWSPSATKRLSRSFKPCSRCFFFQAEDGIRGRNVTGVQTCALPIYHIQQNQVGLLEREAPQRHQSVIDIAGLVAEAAQLVDEQLPDRWLVVHDHDPGCRSEEHTSETPVTFRSRMPSSA